MQRVYMGLNLLALGTAIWVPTPIVWAGFALMVIGSDLRARADSSLVSIEATGAYKRTIHTATPMSRAPLTRVL